jgi:predicted RNA-binding Zn-ribbon protein involved in translation (DUF1610 family)
VSGIDDNPASQEPQTASATDPSVASTAELYCAKCKQFSRVPEDATSWTCPNCAQHWEVRRCVSCGVALQHVKHGGGPCPFCGKNVNTWRKQGSIATAADAEQDAAERGFTSKSDQSDNRVLIGCTVAGGYGHDFSAGSRCNIFFDRDHARVSGDGSALDLAYEGMTLEIGGPGEVTSGGGFFGGGFGARGAAEGMAIASVLNALTTKTNIQTVVGIETNDCQLVVMWDKATPEQLKLTLAPVNGHIKSARKKVETSSASRSADPVEQLERLAELQKAGALNPEEFEAAKRKVIEGM